MKIYKVIIFVFLSLIIFASGQVEIDSPDINNDDNQTENPNEYAFPTKDEDGLSLFVDLISKKGALVSSQFNLIKQKINLMSALLRPNNIQDGAALFKKFIDLSARTAQFFSKKLPAAPVKTGYLEEFATLYPKRPSVTVNGEGNGGKLSVKSLLLSSLLQKPGTFAVSSPTDDDIENTEDDSSVNNVNEVNLDTSTSLALSVATTNPTTITPPTTTASTTTRSTTTTTTTTAAPASTTTRTIPTMIFTSTANSMSESTMSPFTTTSAAAPTSTTTRTTPTTRSSTTPQNSTPFERTTTIPNQQQPNITDELANAMLSMTDEELMQLVREYFPRMITQNRNNERISGRSFEEELNELELLLLKDASLNEIDLSNYETLEEEYDPNRHARVGNLITRRKRSFGNGPGLISSFQKYINSPNFPIRRFQERLRGHRENEEIAPNCEDEKENFHKTYGVPRQFSTEFLQSNHEKHNYYYPNEEENSLFSIIPKKESNVQFKIIKPHEHYAVPQEYDLHKYDQNNSNEQESFDNFDVIFLNSADKKNEKTFHTIYNVPHETYSVPEKTKPHQTYSAPKVNVRHGTYSVPENTKPHHTYSVPKVNIPHGTYIIPKDKNLHKTYSVPKINVPHGTYSVPEEKKPHQIYSPPNVNKPHEIYSVPEEKKPHETYAAPKVNVPHAFYLVPQKRKPSEAHSARKINVPHGSYSIPEEKKPHQTYSAPIINEPHEIYSVPEEKKPNETYSAPKVNVPHGFYLIHRKIKPNEVYSTPKINIPHGRFSIPYEKIPDYTYSVPKLNVPLRTYSTPEKRKQHQTYSAPIINEPYYAVSEDKKPHETYAAPKVNVPHGFYLVPQKIKRPETYSAPKVNVPHKIYSIPEEKKLHDTYSVPETNLPHKTTPETYSAPNVFRGTSSPPEERKPHQTYSVPTVNVSHETNSVTEKTRPLVTYSEPKVIVVHQAYSAPEEKRHHETYTPSKLNEIKKKSHKFYSVPQVQYQTYSIPEVPHEIYSAPEVNNSIHSTEEAYATTDLNVPQAIYSTSDLNASHETYEIPETNDAFLPHEHYSAVQFKVPEDIHSTIDIDTSHIQTPTTHELYSITKENVEQHPGVFGEEIHMPYTSIFVPEENNVPQEMFQNPEIIAPQEKIQYQPSTPSEKELSQQFRQKITKVNVLNNKPEKESNGINLEDIFKTPRLDDNDGSNVGSRTNTMNQELFYIPQQASRVPVSSKKFNNDDDEPFLTDFKRLNQEESDQFSRNTGRPFGTFTALNNFDRKQFEKIETYVVPKESSEKQVSNSDEDWIKNEEYLKPKSEDFDVVLEQLPKQDEEGDEPQKLFLSILNPNHKVTNFDESDKSSELFKDVRLETTTPINRNSPNKGKVEKEEELIKQAFLMDFEKIFNIKPDEQLFKNGQFDNFVINRDFQNEFSKNEKRNNVTTESNGDIFKDKFNSDNLDDTFNGNSTKNKTESNVNNNNNNNNRVVKNNKRKDLDDFFKNDPMIQIRFGDVNKTNKNVEEVRKSFIIHVPDVNENDDDDDVDNDQRKIIKKPFSHRAVNNNDRYKSLSPTNDFVDNTNNNNDGDVDDQVKDRTNNNVQIVQSPPDILRQFAEVYKNYLKQQQDDIIDDDNTRKTNYILPFKENGNFCSSHVFLNDPQTKFDYDKCKLILSLLNRNDRFNNNIDLLLNDNFFSTYNFNSINYDLPTNKKIANLFRG